MINPDILQILFDRKSELIALLEKPDKRKNLDQASIFAKLAEVDEIKKRLTPKQPVNGKQTVLVFEGKKVPASAPDEGYVYGHPREETTIINPETTLIEP